MRLSIGCVAAALAVVLVSAGSAAQAPAHRTGAFKFTNQTDQEVTVTLVSMVGGDGKNSFPDLRWVMAAGASSFLQNNAREYFYPAAIRYRVTDARGTSEWTTGSSPIDASGHLHIEFTTVNLIQHYLEIHRASRAAPVSPAAPGPMPGTPITSTVPAVVDSGRIFAGSVPSSAPGSVPGTPIPQTSQYAGHPAVPAAGGIPSTVPPGGDIGRFFPANPYSPPGTPTPHTTQHAASGLAGPATAGPPQAPMPGALAAQAPPSRVSLEQRRDALIRQIEDFRTLADKCANDARELDGHAADAERGQRLDSAAAFRASARSYREQQGTHLSDIGTIRQQLAEVEAALRTAAR